MFQWYHHVDELCWILSVVVSWGFCPLSSIPAMEVSWASSTHQGSPHLPHHLPHHDPHYHHTSHGCQSCRDWNRKVLKQWFLVQIFLGFKCQNFYLQGYWWFWHQCLSTWFWSNGKPNQDGWKRSQQTVQIGWWDCWWWYPRKSRRWYQWMHILLLL